MRKVIQVASVFLVSTAMLTSCVSKKKYMAATEANDALRTQNQMLSSKLDNANKSITELQKDVDMLSKYYSNANTKLNMSEEQIKEQQKKLRQLQNMIYAQHKATDELYKKIADALVNFNTDELTVSVRDGRVYVSMQEELLFPSGSAKVNPDGKKALGKLAAVLKQNKEIDVEVEGHTDNKAINTSKYPDNWALSVGRSTAIARILISDYDVDPTRIIASGQSKYNPVASNDDEMGRAKNRRTEIILEPQLDELMHLLSEMPGIAQQ